MKCKQYDQKEIKFYLDTILHFATESTKDQDIIMIISYFKGKHYNLS